MGDNTIANLEIKSPLLPDRMRQPDFFVCDIFDAAPKGDIASMEHPIFSVATKPDLKSRRYQNGALWLEVKPSGEGLATVHDRDILIYCISQIIAALNEGREVSQYLRFKAYDLLTATNRGTDGRGYEQLRAALIRLRGTTIETNITTNDTEVLEGFGLIDSYKIIRETREGRMLDLEVKLSDWVFNAIRAREILTLNRNYFRLRKPLERRLYELARKHCGSQTQWRIRLDVLQNKCGSTSTIREFRRLVKVITDQDGEFHHMPDYSVRLGEDDMVTFVNRGSVPAKLSNHENDTPGSRLRPLDPEVYSAARFVAPGWDVYFLEREFKAWLKSTPKNPEAAYIGFCKSWAARRKKP